MCTNMDSFIKSPDDHYGFDFQMQRLQKIAFDSEKDYFLFTGGEPTLHPGFLSILTAFRKKFPRAPIYLLTNGRKFCYQDFTRKVLRLGKTPFDVVVTIHGHNAATHDSITRSRGSFSQAMRGLENIFKLRRPGQGVEIRIVLHKLTIPWLDKTLLAILNAFPDTAGPPKGGPHPAGPPEGGPYPAGYRLVLIYFEVEGQAEKNFRRIKLSLGECGARIWECNELLKKFPEVRLYHFPLCVLNEDLRPLVWDSLPGEDVCYLEECRSCALKKKCPGAPAWYPKWFDSSDIRATLPRFRGTIKYHPKRVLLPDRCRLGSKKKKGIE